MHQFGISPIAELHLGRYDISFTNSSLWMVVVLAFLQGVALSFDQPTRAALVPELVPKEELLNAVWPFFIQKTGGDTYGNEQTQS